MAEHEPGLSFEEALARVREHVPELEAEAVPLAALPGRVLAEELRSPIDHPPFANSAMDGFALRAADTPGELRLVGESSAGSPWTGRVGAGEALRISTGAAMPEGADAVLRVEDAAIGADARVRATVAVEPGRFVRERGDDLAAGTPVLRAGHLVRAHEVAAIAAIGHASASCRRRARVAILASGDELAQPGGPLEPGQVYDANRPGLTAQAEAAGAEVVDVQAVPDDRSATEEMVRDLLEGTPTPDLVLTSGGVSVGPHDHLRPAFEAVGVTQVFWGVEIRPGHPLWLGARGAQVVLGLPGNPVSAAVCFHVFGRELLGLRHDWTRRATLVADYPAATPRAEFVRCRWRGDGLEPVAHQGSHAVSGLAGAEALALIPAGGAGVGAGDRVAWCPL